MRKLITTLLLLLPVLAFGQLIRSDQINTDPFKGDSLYLANPLTYVAPSNDTITFVGTSITAGTGASITSLDYASWVCKLIKLRQNNQGVSGSTLGNPSSSGTSLINNLSRIPTKRTHQKWLIIEDVVNDIIHGFSYSSTTYATDVATVRTNAVSKGWSSANIVWLTNGYINPASYKLTMTTAQFQMRQDSFNNVIRTVATSNGDYLVDENKILAPMGMFISAEGLHPNNRGHLIYAQNVMDIISPNVLKKGQPLAVNGISEIRNIKVHNYQISPDTTNILLLRDTTGGIVSVNNLPPATQTTRTFFVNGQVLQFGATPPNAGYGVNDIGLYQDATLWGVFNGNGGFASYYKPIDAFGNMTFGDTYSLGNINFLTNSAQSFKIAPGGYVVVGNSPSTLSPIAGDVWITQGNAGFKSTVSTVTGAFMPLLSDDFTAIWNSYNAGGIHFYLANGTNGNKTEMMRLFQNGHLIFNPGGTYIDNPIALMQFAYNTGGIMYPRVTTAGRDSMAYVLGSPGVTPGSYTVAPTITIGPPSAGGIQATATVALSGGGLGAVTITNQGSGYYSVPTATLSGGTGSGGAITLKINMTNQKGLVIYNSTNSRIESYNGTNWVGSPGNASTGLSTQLISGDGSYVTNKNTGHVIFIPTTGGTVNLVNNQTNVINPSGALLALTINLPSSPTNDDRVNIKFTQNITTVTYSGGTVVDGITAPTAGGLTVLTYDSGTTSWY